MTALGAPMRLRLPTLAQRQGEMIAALCEHEPLVAPHADLVARLTAANRRWAATGLAIAHVAPLGRRIFDFDPEGRRALILPCADETRALVDLAAIDPHDATWTRSYFGRAWCIGEEHVPFSTALDGALNVFTSVWEYLAADGEGILILDHRRALFELAARGIERVACASLAAGRRLRAQLSAQRAVPEILVPEEASTMEAT